MGQILNGRWHVRMLPLQDSGLLDQRELKKPLREGYWRDRMHDLSESLGRDLGNERADESDDFSDSRQLRRLGHRGYFVRGRRIAARTGRRSPIVPRVASSPTATGVEASRRVIVTRSSSEHSSASHNAANTSRRTRWGG